MPRRPPDTAAVADLWADLASPDALWRAFHRAARGKRRRPDVAAFEWDIEHQLASIGEALRNGSWQPGGYRQFELVERKRRVISVAPFADRVVHHALMAVVEPILDAHMYPHSYACRLGKGTHTAVDWYQRQARRYAYALKLDLSRYFASIDHAQLKLQIRRAIADVKVLALLDQVIDSGGCAAATLGWSWPGEDLVDQMQRRVGLPIGNLTSQILANWMLDGIDWALAAQPGVGAYLRYVDDLVLLSDDKAALWTALGWLEDQLTTLRLRRHPRKLQLQPTRLRLDFLGYQTSRHQRWLRNDSAYAARRRLRQVADDYRNGAIDLPQVRSHVHAWIGHARHADTAGLRAAMLGELVFQRGSGEAQACPARRGVEQQTRQVARRQSQQERAREP